MDQTHEDHPEEADEERRRPSGSGSEPGDEAARPSGAETPVAPAGSAHGAPTGGSGLATGLQPSGTALSGSPAAGVGSLGTGGGSTAGKPSGSMNR